MRNDENRREDKLNEALSCMHAPDDLYENVVARAAGGKRRRHGRARPLAAVAVAVLAGALAMGGTACAVVNSNFFQRAWGDWGQPEKVRKTYDEDGWTATWDMTFGGMRGEKVPSSVQNAVEPVNYTVEAKGYKLTIEDMVIDANGAGAATFTLENPDGVAYRESENRPSEFEFDPEVSLVDDGTPRLISVDADDGGTSTTVMFDKETSTDTEVRGTIYFVSPGGAESLQKGMKWCLGFGQPRDDAYTETFKPSKVVPTRTFTDGADKVASVSPFSVAVKVNSGNAERVDTTVCSAITLGFNDETQLAVVKEEPQEHPGDDTYGIMSYFNYVCRNGGSADEEIVAQTTEVFDPADVAEATLELREWDKDRFDPKTMTLLPN